MDLDDVDFDGLWSDFKDRVKDFAIENPEAKVDHIFILSDDDVAKMVTASDLDYDSVCKVWKIWVDLDLVVPHESLGWLMNSEKW